MLTYLDTCIVIYWVEGPPEFEARAKAHLSGLQKAGYKFAVSDLTKMECWVKPLGIGDGALLLDYQKAFLAANIANLTLSSSVFLHAADIRGRSKYATGKNYSFVDSLHLAAAIEAGCDRFLSNDARLLGFGDIAVEILP
ncbi:MAG: type II toxin-antitoxin system VapC family toxin [Planctomycetes bacterium]|nr:type II toxin-antitoxin system VapC family toxin [Planctomycetota bacterium]